MNRGRQLVLGGVAAMFWCTGAHAAPAKQQPSHHVRVVTPTFRLIVDGTPSKGATFWVAHGPLAGRFGVTRLQAKHGGEYSARVTLPADGTTTFEFLAAQGVELVHGNPEPAGAVVVLTSFDSVTATQAAQRVVRYSVPLG